MNYHENGVLTDHFHGSMRDVLGLRLDELVPVGSRSHKKREPVVIDGEPVIETLKTRIARETRELEVAVQLIAGQLARKVQQLEHLSRFPDDDPFVDGTKLEFQKSFPSDPDRKYTYLALRAAGHWHLTGARSPQSLTWAQLVSWMGLGVDEVWKLGTRSGRKKVIG